MITETDYFLEYLRQVTDKRKPHIDAWFLTHPHDDHCEVFLNLIENYADALTFDNVYVNFAPIDFYSDTDEEADRILHDYARLRPLFEAKEQILYEGDYSISALRSSLFCILLIPHLPAVMILLLFSVWSSPAKA